MRAQRIKTGFHRLGVVLLLVFAVPGGLFAVTTRPDNMFIGVALAVIGAVLYLLARGLGWIAAGFAGSD